VPLIDVKIVEGLFSVAQKREMIARLTDTMIAIVGEEMRQVTWVVLDEVHNGDWGIGGEPLYVEDVLKVSDGARRRQVMAQG
jgi:4-oxalocrotonate tautomerase